MTGNNSRPSMWLLPLLALAPLCCVMPVIAQTGAGSIRGTVRDSTGAMIPGASVTLTHLETNRNYEAATNEAGVFVLPSIAPGKYRIIAKSPGMNEWEGEALLRTGQDASLDIALALASSTTAITVHADAVPLVSTVNSTLGSTVERQRIEQLPQNGRSVTNLITMTTPGTEDAAARLRVYGLRGGSMELLQDGATLIDRSWGYVHGRMPGLDTVEEFKVETNNASAKSNRPATAILRTKSGTNQYHGSAFLTNRNNGIGVARRRQDFYEKPPHLVRNEFGASVGGPLSIPKVYDGKNRTFFFFSYEGFTNRSAGTQSARLPTAEMREGDYSQLVDSVGRPYTIYDPWSTNEKTWSRTPYPGNRIPAFRQSGVSKYLYSVTPLPTMPDVNPSVAANYFAPAWEARTDNTGTLRLDHRFSDRDQVFFRITHGDTYNNTPDSSSSSPRTLDGSANFKVNYEPSRHWASSWTRVISSSLFSELLVNYSVTQKDTLVGDRTKEYASTFGLPNPFNEPGFPEIGNIGFAGDTIEQNNSQEDYTTIWNIAENMTKSVGRHEFQFGGHFRRESIDTLSNQQYTKGMFQFNSLATSLYDPATGVNAPGTVPRSGHEAANFFLGAVGSSTVVMARKHYHFDNHELAGYLQDNLRLGRLTLNLGVRLENYSPLKEQNGMITAFDLKSRSVVVGRPIDELIQKKATTPGVVRTYENMGVKFITPEQAGLPAETIYGDSIDFNPRIGFAYRVTNGSRPLVLRGGYSRFSFPIQVVGYTGTSRSNVPLNARLFRNLNAAQQSPDGIQNYLLRTVPRDIVGVNTTNILDANNPTPGAVGSFGINYFAPYQPNSRAAQWNLTLEHEVLRDTVVRAVFVGTRGTKLDQMYNINSQIPDYVWLASTGTPIPQGSLAGTARREWTDLPYGGVQLNQKSGYSNFSGIQLEAERRFSRGMAFQFFYVMSNALRAGGNTWNDDQMYDARYYMPGSVPQDWDDRNRAVNYHRDTQIPKHRLRWNWLVDLPFGKGKLIGKNSGGFLDRVIGGWQFGGYGNAVSRYWSLPTGNWGSFDDIEIYGTKYPIQDCRSGRCIDGYLYYNGYIPANRINSYDASGKPNGVMGVPSNYKPSNQPVHPFPADGGSPADPNYAFYGSNTVHLTLKNGTTQRTSVDTLLHPWRNQWASGPMLTTVNASLFKSVPITEQVRLRLNVDFFNVLNAPGLNLPDNSTGILSLQNSAQSARQLQLTLRLTW